MEPLKVEIERQAAKVTQLKAASTTGKPELQSEIDKLVALKKQLAALELSSIPSAVTAPVEPKFDRAGLEELLKKRFFYAPSFGIYGGVSGLFDYGPPGCALQANILDCWRKHFVFEEDMLEVDTTILTPHDVLKTSGHVDRFSDLMCKDLKTGDIFRVDHLVEGELERRIEADAEARLPPPAGSSKKSKSSAAALSAKDVLLSDEQKAEYQSILAQIDNYNAQQLDEIIRKYQIKSPNGNDVSEPEVFNLMFGTSIGPTGALAGFMRPETAQGQFLNFKRLLEFNMDRMPFASAQIGRSFRNEISPRSGLLRVREFTMAEIEHFVHPDRKDHKRFEEIKDVRLSLLPAHIQSKGKTDIVEMSIGDAVAKGVVNNQTLAYFMARIHLFLTKIGIKSDRLRFRQHMSNEMAHYACDCWDAEIKSSYGWVECVGCADRSAYDLTKHSERTKERLVARETLTEPRLVEKLTLQINKKLFGPAFKKDAKLVETHLSSLAEPELIKLRDQLASGKCFINVEGGRSFELSTEMVSVELVKEKIHVLEYIPNVIEPSFGIGRILYSLLEHVWWVREGDESRNVLSFPPLIAPTKCLLVPLSNNVAFHPTVQEISEKLRKLGISSRTDDSSTSIGRRYARNDELGTPFAVTVDFQTLQDQTVTLRERDSTKQIRASADTVLQLIKSLVEENTSWDKVLTEYPVFTQQELDS